MTGKRSGVSEMDDLDKISLFLDLAREPVFDVQEIRTPWRFVLGIGISFALAVAILAGAVSYLGAAYAMNHADRRVDSAVDDRNDRLAQQQAAINEYRRQQCVIVTSLPQPWTPDLRRLHDEVLRCPELTPAPTPTR